MHMEQKLGEMVAASQRRKLHCNSATKWGWRRVHSLPAYGFPSPATLLAVELEAHLQSVAQLEIQL